MTNKILIKPFSDLEVLYLVKDNILKTDYNDSMDLISKLTVSYYKDEQRAYNALVDYGNINIEYTIHYVNDKYGLNYSFPGLNNPLEVANMLMYYKTIKVLNDYSITNVIDNPENNKNTVITVINNLLDLINKNT